MTKNSKKIFKTDKIFLHNKVLASCDDAEYDFVLDYKNHQN